VAHVTGEANSNDGSTCSENRSTLLLVVQKTRTAHDISSRGLLTVRQLSKYAYGFVVLPLLFAKARGRQALMVIAAKD
jgi:hypothetical protein